MEPTEKLAPRPPEGFGRKPLVILIGVLVVAVGIYFVFFHATGPSPTPSVRHLPFGPDEQAYAAKLQFGDLTMSRAENFLHQEVTILAGDVTNGGDRSVSGIEATITFTDDMQQIVLRETRSVLASGTAPLESGKTAHFEISFDYVPPSWNVQVPSVHVSGLALAGTKR